MERRWYWLMVLASLSVQESHPSIMLSFIATYEAVYLSIILTSAIKSQASWPSEPVPPTLLFNLCSLGYRFTQINYWSTLYDTLQILWRKQEHLFTPEQTPPPWKL